MLRAATLAAARWNADEEADAPPGGKPGVGDGRQGERARAAEPEFDTEVFFLEAAERVAAAQHGAGLARRLLSALGHGGDGAAAVRRLFWAAFAARAEYPLGARFVAVGDAARAIASALAAHEGRLSSRGPLGHAGMDEAAEPTLEEALDRIAAQLREAAGGCR